MRRWFPIDLRSVFACVAVIAMSTFSSTTHAQEAEASPVRPGKEHALLALQAGQWAAETHFRAAPGQPVTVSKGTESARMLGGLWLLSHFKGEFFGAPFEGHGTTGFDPSSGKFVGTWVDSMSTGLTISEGTYDEATKTISYKHASTDPQGRKINFSSKVILRGANRHTMVMYMPGPDGKEFESLRIEYTRSQKAEAADANEPKEDPLAKVAGNWDLSIDFGIGQNIDYTLRIARTAAGPAAVLVSPRSGEHKFKSVAWKSGVLKMAIVRTYQDTDVELLFEGKLGEKGLVGEVTATSPNTSERSGSWTATRAKK